MFQTHTHKNHYESDSHESFVFFAWAGDGKNVKQTVTQYTLIQPSGQGQYWGTLKRYMSDIKNWADAG